MSGSKSATVGSAHELMILKPGTAVFGTAAGEGFSGSPCGHPTRGRGRHLPPHRRRHPHSTGDRRRRIHRGEWRRPGRAPTKGRRFISREMRAVFRLAANLDIWLVTARSAPSLKRRSEIAFYHLATSVLPDGGLCKSAQLRSRISNWFWKIVSNALTSRGIRRWPIPSATFAGCRFCGVAFSLIKQAKSKPAGAVDGFGDVCDPT
jgi:hypothetical protein